MWLANLTLNYIGKIVLRFLALAFSIFTLWGAGSAFAQGDQCSDLLQSTEAADSETVELTPKAILLDLASRIEILMTQLSQKEYIKTDRLRYMKAMVLETTVLNEYYGDLYAHLFPDRQDIAQGFRDRQGFLEALNAYVSNVGKYRDLEKWLLKEQSDAQVARKSNEVAAYQILRDELNLIYYGLLAEMHDRLLGHKTFYFDEPKSWNSWFKEYVTFLESLPETDPVEEKDFLLSVLNSDFRKLHDQMSAIEIEGIEKLTPQEVEVLVHDLRRQIRWESIILLKNSHLIRMQDVEHDWLELDNSVVQGVIDATGANSRYVKLNPPVIDQPILFPQLSFYAIYFFTDELGSIKDNLERVLFLEEIRASLRDKAAKAPNSARNEAIKLAATMTTAHSLSRRSRDFLRVIKESYLFLYTSSWVREFNLKY